MRSFERNHKSLDELELVCPYHKCGRTFYTNNPKAIYCCDSHRGKGYRHKNRRKIEHFRVRRKLFEKNAKIIQSLHSRKITKLSHRDLDIAGFHFDVLNKPKKTEDERVCYEFFNYVLAPSKENSNQYEIIKITK